jgi:hypothetical protein
VKHRPRRAATLAATLVLLARAAAAQAYVPDDRWGATASGPATAAGLPITLTWSLVRDGVSIPGESASNLIAFLDGRFGAGAGGTNFAARPWFHLFQESFDRWSQLGGITFVYEPNDSGSALSGAAGALGVRGDIRIGGANIDGTSGTLAYTYLPSNGDMVLDTAESSFFGASTNNYRNFRNTFMHELGHAFGLQHVESTTERFLMEPYIDVTFDGPQLDDIRGIQGMYGDALEKTFNGLGNGVPARATSLGALSVGGSLAIGAAARGTQVVAPGETDFVSIANAADVDFFSFSIAAPATIDVTLTPLGGVFNQAVEGGLESSFNANARNDLALAVFGPNGVTQLGAASSAAAGQIESLAGLQLASAGTYFVRVTGSADNVQLYELALAARSLLVAPTGDFNGDGTVDARDFLVWQRAVGTAGSSPADGNHDGVVDKADLAVWRQQFGSAVAAAGGAFAAVPEPGALALALLGATFAAHPCARRRVTSRAANPTGPPAPPPTVPPSSARARRRLRLSPCGSCSSTR